MVIICNCHQRMKESLTTGIKYIKPELIKPYQYCSNFLGFHKDRSDDWCFTVKEAMSPRTRLAEQTATKYGISYWDEESEKKLASDTRDAYDMPVEKNSS